MNQARVDLLIQYILSVAAQGWGDYNDKEVGPIHIIKYVYLADLAYAMKHGGETYTGIPWIFHNFGPWDVGLYNRIPHAAKAIKAHKRTITETQYEDFDRWSLMDDHLMDGLRKQLPGTVALAINGNFRQFQTDTYDLLDHVYSTIPMRHAAPGDLLPFDVAAKIHEQQQKEDEELQAYQAKRLTAREQKRRKQAFRDLKEKIQAKIAANRRQQHDMYVTPTAPRYDELFWKGQDWLDSLAGGPIKAEKGELSVSDNIWKSPARSEPHV
ncbi:MAG: hypothetical protein A2511_17905 [Deltaproteobacteria bacterium RIFOXYD12_FULL_50_9]|nr:MAG: hypothetical protein A2511_17905 [Deltaproteobacteria bacterium RIFOXYD12_FULL_50_9]